MLSSRLLRPAAALSAVKRLTAAPVAARSTSFRFMSASAPTSSHPHTPLPGAQGSIIYTETDEAPALATYSLLPVIAKVSECMFTTCVHVYILHVICSFFFVMKDDVAVVVALKSHTHSTHSHLLSLSLSQFGAKAGIDVVPCDISVAGRVLAAFPDKLDDSQKVPNNLAYLGELCKTPECNIVKLPNVSASIPQLVECISELRNKGYDVPLYPAEPKNDEEQAIQDTYASILGSAVNPVLREGNSDRRVAAPVKAYAQKNPHRMGMWSKAGRTHVAHMTHGDFYDSEQSTIVGSAATDVAIEFTPTSSGETVVMKDSTPLEAGEVIDAGFMNVKALQQFFEDEIEDAKESDLLLSLVRYMYDH